jgi:hypothetical protein
LDIHLIVSQPIGKRFQYLCLLYCLTDNTTVISNISHYHDHVPKPFNKMSFLFKFLEAVQLRSYPHLNYKIWIGFKAFAENQTGRTIKAFRDDKGGEYMSKQSEAFMQEHGIAHEHTTRATPQQNGVAEITNCILENGITSMLSASHLPASFWGEALSTFLHVLNHSPTSVLPGKTPYQAWHGKIPSVDHLHVFGCQAYVHVQKDQWKGFEAKSLKCIFIGYPPDYKGWRCYSPATKSVIISQDVIFDESQLPGTSLTLENPQYTPLFIPPDLPPHSVGAPVPTTPEAPSHLGSPPPPDSAVIPPKSLEAPPASQSPPPQCSSG